MAVTPPPREPGATPPMGVKTVRGTPSGSMPAVGSVRPTPRGTGTVRS